MAQSPVIQSEIGRLRRVIVHAPGSEVEAMSPQSAEEDLYNDIVPLRIVQREHRELSAFLSLVAEVSDAAELLERALTDSASRKEFLDPLLGFYGAERRREELDAMDAAELSRVVIEGLPARHDGVESLFSGRRFDLPPLPNLYFMRDAGFVFGDRPAACSMRFDVRHPESLIDRAIFRSPAALASPRLSLDGPALRSDGFSFEGGDVQVLGPATLAIGVSERTSARAVDALAKALAVSAGVPVRVFAVELPKERATIHLDMVFTMIDRDACLVHERSILGTRRCRVARLDANPAGRTSVREQESLLAGLAEAGLPLQPVITGGPDPIQQDREQWMSGANSFAFAPGKILMYSCNPRTLDALDAAGFMVKSAGDFTGGGDDPFKYGRLAVGFEGAELARGGGGARCMTLPVERDALP
ncbi:MAG: hypothetical protein JXA15_03670 [Spirochaetales bacterium]|nr:hypothetical protein [Spirochaetales bacterium]